MVLPSTEGQVEDSRTGMQRGGENSSCCGAWGSSRWARGGGCRGVTCAPFPGGPLAVFGRQAFALQRPRLLGSKPPPLLCPPFCRGEGGGSGRGNPSPPGDPALLMPPPHCASAPARAGG